MDRVIRISLGLLLVILIVFVSVVSYQVWCGKGIPDLIVQHVFLYLHHHDRFPALQCDALFTGTGRYFREFSYRGTVQCPGYYRNS